MQSVIQLQKEIRFLTDELCEVKKRLAILEATQKPSPEVSEESIPVVLTSEQTKKVQRVLLEALELENLKPSEKSFLTTALKFERLSLKQHDICKEIVKRRHPRFADK